MNHPFVAWQQELAKLFGGYVINLNLSRYHRMLPLLRGWPRGTVMFLDEELMNFMISRMQRDWTNFTDLMLRTEQWLVTYVFVVQSNS